MKKIAVLAAIALAPTLASASSEYCKQLYGRPAEITFVVSNDLWSEEWHKGFDFSENYLKVATLPNGVTGAIRMNKGQLRFSTMDREGREILLNCKNETRGLWGAQRSSADECRDELYKLRADLVKFQDAYRRWLAGAVGGRMTYVDCAIEFVDEFQDVLSSVSK